VISLQSSRKSNELLDAITLQIASYIQNTLPKKFAYHQFDTQLLAKLEPIFYSFLVYTTKPALKQKTLQAWNSTFGRSTVSSLGYSKRLETLFIEIREETIANSKQATSVVLSLPCFKHIDILLNQSTNATNSTILNESSVIIVSADEKKEEEEEKENTPENLNNEPSNPNMTKNNNNKNIDEFLSNSTNKSYLGHDANSSSSVPIAQLLGADAKSTHPKLSGVVSSGESSNQNIEVAAMNFVFSPVAGKNSFLNFAKPQVLSFSASKAKSVEIKTPESNHVVRQSPRSLRQVSKRKIDLNNLIDQVPDKEFTEIKKSNASMVNLMSKFGGNGDSSGKKMTSKAEKRKSAPLKQPLTEHQKEIRKQKSFIPLEIQSVVFSADSQMDSQMSMLDDDTNTQSNFASSFAIKGCYYLKY
jgi:hypothetical protein